MNKNFFFFAVCSVSALIAVTAFAQNSYKLIVPFPSYGNFPGATEAAGPAEYIKIIYYFSLGFGALLAFLMIAIGVIRFTVSESIGGKDEAKKQITSAIWGLVLLLASYLILQTINPELSIANLQNPVLKPVPPPTNTSAVKPIVQPGNQAQTAKIENGMLTFQFNPPQSEKANGFLIAYKNLSRDVSKDIKWDSSLLPLNSGVGNYDYSYKLPQIVADAIKSGETIEITIKTRNSHFLTSFPDQVTINCRSGRCF